MNTKSLVAVLVLLIVFGTGVTLVHWSAPVALQTNSQQQAVATSTSGVDIASAQGTKTAYGSVTLKLNQTATFEDLSLTPISIQEDSRCPTDVQCIQAGTVRVVVQIVSGMGTSTSTITLNKVFTTEAQSITLTAVTPDKVSTVQNTPQSYQFTFTVVPRS